MPLWCEVCPSIIGPIIWQHSYCSSFTRCTALPKSCSRVQVCFGKYIRLSPNWIRDMRCRSFDSVISVPWPRRVYIDWILRLPWRAVGCIWLKNFNEENGGDNNDDCAKCDYSQIPKKYIKFFVLNYISLLGYKEPSHWLADLPVIRSLNAGSFLLGYIGSA